MIFTVSVQTSCNALACWLADWATVSWWMSFLDQTLFWPAAACCCNHGAILESGVGRTGRAQIQRGLAHSVPETRKCVLGITPPSKASKEQRCHQTDQQVDAAAGVRHCLLEVHREVQAHLQRAQPEIHVPSRNVWAVRRLRWRPMSDRIGNDRHAFLRNAFLHVAGNFPWDLRWREKSAQTGWTVCSYDKVLNHYCSYTVPQFVNTASP